MSSESSVAPANGGVFIHPQAICESSAIGAGTRIWAFAHVLPNAKIGKDCNICDGVFIENDVVMGDQVTIKCGVQLWDGLTLEDMVFIGPNVTFTNTLFPRSKAFQKEFLRTVVCEGASVGANATILPGITVGRNAMVGAGSVVTQSVPANAIVFGNPARIVGYVDAQDNTRELASNAAPEEAQLLIEETGVKGATLHALRQTADLGSSLVSVDFAKEIPFLPRRYVLVCGGAGEQASGQYAYRTGHQFLTCIRGACAVLVDDGVNRREVRLQEAHRGLYLPPMIWSTRYKFTEEAVLLAFISEYEDNDDAVRDYGQFLKEIGR